MVLTTGARRPTPVATVLGALATALLTALTLVGCVQGTPSVNTSSGNSSTGGSGTGGGSTPTPSPTVDPLAGLTMAQRVGQLFMVGTTATAAQQVTLSAITTRHVGSVFLSGRSTLGVKATAAVVAKLKAAVTTTSTGGLPLFVATDQEGGEVQVLHGAGFSAIPTGVAQGELAPTTLQTDSADWASQLKAAGVNMDLAPVVDLVGSAAVAKNNPPIGAFMREFGYSAATIVAHANAFREGMSSEHVLTVIKHFPGLGFVTANTDVASGVTDKVTGPDGVDVGIYRNQIAGGANIIMVSSATYDRIDASSPGVFSPTMVTSLLRGQLGFSGLVMSDDLSGAKQVEYLSPANRAIEAIQAGVDIVLVSKDPTVAAAMVDAVLAKAKSDPAFAAQVTAAAARVVTFKRSILKP